MKHLLFILGLVLAVSFCKGSVASRTNLRTNPVSDASTRRARVPTGCPPTHSKPADCDELAKNGYTSNGIYTIWPRSRIYAKQSAQVYCDMTTAGGGWTLIQRRGAFGSSQNFFGKSWNYYKKGFGSLSRDFWLGNDLIYTLTNQGLYTVRFEMTADNLTSAFASYEEFWIDDETNKYRLHISEYSGTAGDSMATHNEKPFSTPDRDNQPGEHCARTRSSGWWFYNCMTSNLNGLYKTGSYQSSVNDGIEWETFGGRFNSMVASEIKIRPAV